ncbi:DUF1992 domain-containing protein [Propionibacteriaceae bacterium Y1685]|uniref:DnaJ family domain-containing protein n=1 Tax=Microlunatus sp. Y1700 TaxID=3418487 RepID=UPI003B7F7377
MTPESWADRRYREAAERGEFDNLPGQGKPIPGLGQRQDENWWIKGLMEREDIAMPLPESLALRKEVGEISQTLADVRTEEVARRIITDLNERIARSHRRRLDGPPIHINLLDVEATLDQWRSSR